MSEKQSKRKRKEAGYKSSDDPIHERKYSVFQCYKVIIPDPKRPKRVKCGAMLVAKDPRQRYLQSKKEKTI